MKDDRRIEEELEHHLAAAAAELEARGMAPEAARRAARLRLGGSEQIHTDWHDQRVWIGLESLARDLRHAGRSLRRSPGFSLAVVVLLALGIGVATAALSLADSILWRPLAFPQSEQLVTFYLRNRASGESREISWNEYRAFAERNQTLSALTVYGDNGAYATVRARGGLERALVNPVAANYFAVLGVRPASGRLPRSAETGVAVATAAHASWLGETVVLNGAPVTVVGVLAPSPQILDPLDTDLFVPLPQNSEPLEAIGRLRPGRTVTDAAADLDAVLARSEPADEGWSVTMNTLLHSDTGYLAPELTLYLWGAGLLFVLAAVNAASLWIGRGLRRRAETALRLALGAGRWQLARPMLFEAIETVLAASVLGLWLAHGLLAGYRLLTAHADLPRWTEIGVRWPVGLACAAAALALLVGLSPAWGAARAARESRIGARLAARGRSSRLRARLVIAQTAMAMMLLAGAGLFLASLLRLRAADVGFNPGQLLVARVSLAGPAYAAAPVRAVFAERLLDQARAIPGVRAAVAATHLPFTSAEGTHYELLDSAPQRRDTLATAVSPGYFSALGIPLLLGQDLGGGAQPEAVINANFAAHVLGGQNPLGRTLRLEANPDLGIAAGAVRIVGVVGNVHEVGINEVPFDTIYLPLALAPPPELVVGLRTGAPTAAVTAALRHAVAGLDSGQVVFGVTTMRAAITADLRGARLDVAVIAVFALLALLLAGVGLYATVNDAVTQRVREIGIRMALGARAGQVVGWVAAQAAALAGVGLLLGGAAALGLGRTLRSALYLDPRVHNGLIYRVSTHDPWVLSGAAAALALAALGAAWRPARWAARVDPAVVLRAE